MDTTAGEEVTRPVVNVIGERVALGPLSRVHLPSYQRWVNDIATQAWAGYPALAEPFSIERVTQWYERAATDTERLPFTIYETSAWRPIGLCVLRDINRRHGTAEFGLTIGDPPDRGQGYGTEAVGLLLDIAFTGLGLRNVQLQVYAFNRAGLRAYEKAGFREIGRRRAACSMGGRFWDVVYMDCLAGEFESPVLDRLLDPGEQR